MRILAPTFNAASSAAKTLLVLAATAGQGRAWSSGSGINKLVSGPQSPHAHPATRHQLSTAAAVAAAAERSRDPVISFPGGGIFFWWQAGTVAALQEVSVAGSELRKIAKMPNMTHLLRWRSCIACVQAEQANETLKLSATFTFQFESHVRLRACPTVTGSDALQHGRLSHVTA